MKKQVVFLIIKSIVATLLFTAAIYNLDNLFEIELSFLEIYFAHTIAYCLLFILFKKSSKINDFYLLLITLIPSIVIDASVLLTTPQLVPLRFPLASIFTILGVLFGFFALRKNKEVSTLIALCIVGYVLLFRFYIVINILHKSEVVKSLNPLSNGLFFAKFINSNNDTININSIPNSSIVVAELYFVGCQPCILKEKMLLEAADSVKRSNYKIVFICSGSASTYEQFKKNCASKLNHDNVVYLYDYQEKLREWVPELDGFPHGIFFKNKTIISSLRGLYNETYKLNLKETIKFLRNE
jgi:hypothetical protein